MRRGKRFQLFVHWPALSDANIASVDLARPIKVTTQPSLSQYIKEAWRANPASGLHPPSSTKYAKYGHETQDVDWIVRTKEEKNIVLMDACP